MKKDTIEIKKQRLEKEYGFIMNDDTERRLEVMCNLSEVVIEKGIEKGIEALILDNLEDGKSEEVIINKLERRFDLNKKDAKEYFDKYARQLKRENDKRMTGSRATS